jgi:nitrogen fixation NifU-like protein
MKLDDLYQEVILDHYKNPRCHGCLSHPSAACSLFNPLCGDQIQLTVKVGKGSVGEIGFSGHGCSISQASASMMAEICQGKGVAEIETLMAQFRSVMRGEMTPEEAEKLGDAVALEGVRKFSARVKCAMLAWEALEKCLEDARKAEASTQEP